MGQIGTWRSVGGAILLALAAMSAVQGQGQEPAPPAAELFFKPAEVLEAQLSPSGQRVAISTTIGGERVGLFVYDLSSAGKITLAARFADIDIWRFDWVNDERLVFQVIDLSEGSARQNAPGLYSVRFDGAEMRELVTRRRAAVVAPPPGGRPGLAPNHRLLTVPAGGGDEVIIGSLHVTANDLVGTTPMRLNVVNGRTQSLDLQAPRNTVSWMFDSRGQARVANVVGGGRRQLHWRAPGQAEWKLIDDVETANRTFTPAFVDNNGTLYVTRDEGPARTQALTRFDFEKGRPEPQASIVVSGFDVAAAPVFGDVAGELLGVRVNADAETTVWYDEAMKSMQQRVDQRLPGTVNRVSCRRCGRSDMVALVRSFSDRDPGALWLVRPGPAAQGEAEAAATWQFIGRVRTDIDPRRMARVSLERIAARDGRDLPVWLTIPPERKPDGKGAAVVLVHGGPWVRGGHWRWSAMQQFLASRGYVVISPEFRGTAGYGAAHLEAGFKQWGQAMQDDVADAARWAMAQGWANRLCIAGASYGGYSALMGLARDGDLYRCGVAWVAVADLFLLLEGSWWIDDDASDEGRRFVLPRRIGDAKQDEAMLKSASPLLQAARIRAPLLLAYGEADRRVPLAHGRRLRDALRAAGNEPQWVSYPEEGHSWLKLSTHVDFARRMEQFLAQHLRQAPP